MISSIWPLGLGLSLAAGLTAIASSGSEEPMRETFSLKAADGYLVEATSRWQSTYNCVSCHTNGLYLLSGAMEPAGEPWRQARSFALEYLDRYIEEKLEPKGQYGAVEGLVATACFLALGDSIRSGTFTPEVRLALDHALSLQDEAGHWPDWLSCNWPPYESDHHFGVTLVAVTLGRAPRDYLARDSVIKAHANIRSWLDRHPPATLHQKGMLLWADAEGGLKLSPENRQGYLAELREAQREDGGWCMASMGDWPRRDGTEQLDASEAYPTAFAIWILSRSGAPASDPAVSNGARWLQQQQRASGRWFSRSQRKDTKHYLSQAATNMATMALRASSPRSKRHKPTPPTSPGQAVQSE
ncbi:MAG: hypothetical protein VX527_03305 [Planctomycetota bacterium]|nr:hypothetical protein [Planctomycetota bacterium]